MPYFGMSAVLAAVDLLIKRKIEKEKPGRFPRPLKNSGGWICLHRHHNEGFPFGFMSKYPDIVKVIPLIIVSALSGALCYLLPERGRRGEKIGLAVVIGGGVSNLYDRFARKYVVDYFSIELKGIRKVIFNLGDIFVLLGTVIVGTARSFDIEDKIL